jgi:hypothetical protein
MIAGADGPGMGHLVKFDSIKGSEQLRVLATFEAMMR